MNGHTLIINGGREGRAVILSCRRLPEFQGAESSDPHAFTRKGDHVTDTVGGDWSKAGTCQGPPSTTRNRGDQRILFQGL